MSDISSENKKVDEFLQTLDKLSRERLMDDQKSQWQLERDIDTLGEDRPKRPSLSSRASSASHDFKDLVFNRTASARTKLQEKWKNREKNASLEYASDDEFDDEGYLLPYRPRTNRRQSRRAANKDMEIDLPTRNSLLSRLSEDHADMDLDFGLRRPVARKTSSLKSFVSVDSDESLGSPRTPQGERPSLMKSMKGSFSDMRGLISEMNMKGSLSDLKKKTSLTEMRSSLSELKKKGSFSEMKGSFSDMERRIRRRGVGEQDSYSDESRESREKEPKVKKFSKKEARRQARVLNLEDRNNVWRAESDEEEVPQWKARVKAHEDNSWIAEEEEDEESEKDAVLPNRGLKNHLHRQISADLEIPTRTCRNHHNRQMSEDSEVDLPIRARNNRHSRRISEDSEMELPPRPARAPQKQAIWAAEDSDEDPLGKPAKPVKPAKPTKPLKPTQLETKPSDVKKSPQKPEAPKPRSVATTSSFGSSKPEPAFKPVPRKPELKTFNKPEPKTLAELEPLTKPEKPPVKAVPPKPAKLSSKAYEAKDSQELKDQILRLSPSKHAAPAKPMKKDFDNDQKDLLKGQLEKLATKKQPPIKPAKPAVQKSDEAEAIGALHALKPTKPSALKAAPKPEALQKFSTIKQEKAVPKNFQSELSGILRSSTEPSLRRGLASASTTSLVESQPAKSSIKKAWTDPATTQISHVTKTRSKGPKRRLPKAATLGNGLAPAKLKTEYEPKLAEAEKPKAKVPPPKPAKKPPPIKAKKPDILAKPRTVSGELFI